MKKKILKEGSIDGRPRQGTELKKVYTVRLEPNVMEDIKKKYGSLTNFINKKLSKRLSTK